MTPVLFTKISNSRGPLSKCLTLKDGKLVKTAAADLVDGRAIRVAVRGIEELAETVEGLSANEALTFGITRFKDVRIVTQKALARGAKNAIARDRKGFRYPDGRAGLMLDIDQPKDGSRPLRHGEFDAILCRLLPWWRDVARLYRPSTSALRKDAMRRTVERTPFTPAEP
jgi:hypothetical protein